jgi:hypothetical protein
VSNRASAFSNFSILVVVKEAGAVAEVAAAPDLERLEVQRRETAAIQRLGP